MNVKEYAEEKGLIQDEVKKMFGLKSWNSPIPETALSENTPHDNSDTPSARTVPPEEQKQPAPPESKLKTVKKAEPSEKDKINSCKGLGTKSPYWETHGSRIHEKMKK